MIKLALADYGSLAIKSYTIPMFSDPAMIWAQTIQVAMLLINSLTPLDDLIHHPFLSFQRIGRILQSVAIYTKWIIYTKRTFATPTPPLLNRQDISKTLLSHILTQRTLDIQAHKSPWPPPSQIISIFM